MTHKPSILCLDDDPQFQGTLQRTLNGRFLVHSATHFQEAESCLRQSPVDVIVLDYSLGARDGHSVLDDLRRQNWTQPVIVISGVINLDMTVGFLKRRVFGFLEKPFALAELESLLWEATGMKAQPPADDFEIHAPTRKVICQGQQVTLTPTEFEILEFFLKNEGKQISRDDLHEHLWGDSSVSRHTLDTHLLNLKRKLPLFARRLVSVYGTGYFYDRTAN